jgi:hypothetical protein
MLTLALTDANDGKDTNTPTINNNFFIFTPFL